MASQSSGKDIEPVLKFFSLIYILLLIAGLIYSYFYYKSFGIIITQYIDIGEILIMFIPMLNHFGMIFFLSFSILLLLGRKYMVPDPKGLSIKERRKFVFNSLGISTGFLLGIVSTYLLSSSSNDFLLQSSLLIVMFTAIFLPLGLFFLFRYLENENLLNVPIIIREAIFFFIIFISMISMIIMSQTNWAKLKKRNKHFDVTMKDDSSCFSDSLYYYVGRTKRYIFLYHFTQKKTTVINVEDIKQVTFQK